MMPPSSQRTAALRLLAIFVVGAFAALLGAVFVVGAASGIVGGLSAKGSTLAVGLAMGVSLLALSYWGQRAAGEPFAALGLTWGRRRRSEFAFGVVIGLALFLGVAGAQSAMVGATWQFAGLAGVQAAIYALGLTFVLVLVEELLFRGVALRQLQRILGDRSAVALSAVLFGIYHLVQSGNWAMGAVFAFLMPALGGALFGFAAVRTNGLALPLGLHLGGNWVQAALAGFATNGATATDAVWRIALSSEDVQTLMAPDLVPRLPYLVALLLTAIALWAHGQRHRPTPHLT